MEVKALLDRLGVEPHVIELDELGIACCLRMIHLWNLWELIASICNFLEIFL